MPFLMSLGQSLDVYEVESSVVLLAGGAGVFAREPGFDDEFPPCFSFLFELFLSEVGVDMLTAPTIVSATEVMPSVDVDSNFLSSACSVKSTKPNDKCWWVPFNLRKSRPVIVESPNDVARMLKILRFEDLIASINWPPAWQES